MARAEARRAARAEVLKAAKAAVPRVVRAARAQGPEAARDPLAEALRESQETILTSEVADALSWLTLPAAVALETGQTISRTLHRDRGMPATDRLTKARSRAITETPYSLTSLL